MIELLEGYDDKVVAMRITGRVTRSDYQSVFMPAAEAAMQRHEKIRVLVEMADDVEMTPGLMMQDAIFGTRHLLSWEKIAIVTDAEIIQKVAPFFLSLMPFRSHIFSSAQADQARQWIGMN
jgi:hypothetical protein